jgi:hypothetical protein
VCGVGVEFQSIGQLLPSCALEKSKRRKVYNYIYIKHNKNMPRFNLLRFVARVDQFVAITGDHTSRIIANEETDWNSL